MLKIILPENLLPKEQYQALAAQQKGGYTYNVLKEILKLNPTGITTSQINKATYFGYSNIWRYFVILSSTAECFRVERGDTDVYHFNKVIAPQSEVGFRDANIGNNYTIDIVENNYGKFYRIQRFVDTSRSEVHTLRNGILISNKLITELINNINKIKDVSINKV